MNVQTVLRIAAFSAIALTVPAALADSYSTTTTTTEHLPPITEYQTVAPVQVQTTTIERTAPVTEVRTTTIERSPVVTTPVYITPGQSTVTVIKERRQHHLIKAPFVYVD